MIIIGCDFHSRSQQIAMLDTETGEVVEKKLEPVAATRFWCRGFFSDRALFVWWAFSGLAGRAAAPPRFDASALLG